MDHQQVTETASEANSAATEGNVIPLHAPERRAKRVAPLSDEEILALRELLNYSQRARTEFETIKANCPLAARALSTR
jgi:hypothetical protein